MRVHEDNGGVITLWHFEPHRMRLYSKHYAIKYPWICEQIKTIKTKLINIAATDQLGSIFTKGLSGIMFESLQKKLMCW